MSTTCAVASRVCVGVLLMCYGFGLLFDAVLRWLDAQKTQERGR